MKKKIEVEIEFFDDDGLPDDQKYLASIMEGEYRHTIVTSDSVSGCFKELGISIFVIDDYRKRNPAPHTQ